ncbi:RNA polymerase sigma factor SigE [Prauserella rugosa]|uniref:RNA polymerase sigma-70 factor (ECF subfamily) n=1 Tax=Prauserella rugosa TaxID=43354 RepID=A0A660CG66_9PSEU|nr:RNA polymerase sigma factor SigE [Prauserella rugosa]TWH22480.1 RNA polymerase sigma-70 factor (ECF subfamily) [Prauserella rugosa]
MEVPPLSQSSTTPTVQPTDEHATVPAQAGQATQQVATPNDAVSTGAAPQPANNTRADNTRADNTRADNSVAPLEDATEAWTPPTWDEVVREHADRVYRLAYRLSGNAHDAEDLTQETFIRVFRSLASYKPGTFEGWLHRITTNLFLDMARRRSRVRMEGLPEDTDRIVGDDPSPEQVYSETHLDPDLQTALDELPPEFRAAVVLCDVEGLSYEEIGATLGVKLGTVRSRIHRGRQALKASLERAAATRSREALG